jgi:hypothetical protein
MPELSRTDAVAWERGALRWTSAVERFRRGALVAPLHTDLGPTLRALSARCPDALRLVPAVGYAHATLGPADPARHLRPLPGKLPGPLRYTVGLPTYTSYSVRLQILPSGWDELCDLFGVDAPPYVHVTLGYPSEHIADMPEVGELLDGVVLPDGACSRRFCGSAPCSGSPSTAMRRWRGGRYMVAPGLARPLSHSRTHDADEADCGRGCQTGRPV